MAEPETKWDGVTVYTALMGSDGIDADYIRMALHPVLDESLHSLRNDRYPCRVVYTYFPRDRPCYWSTEWKESCLGQEDPSPRWRRFDTDAEALAWLVEGEKK